MDRTTKLLLVACSWLIILSNSVGFVPSALGSWSAGIDLRRQTIQATGQMTPIFYDAQQSSQFEQSLGDPVYGIYLASFTIMAGAETLAQALSLLYLIPLPLLVYTAGVALALRTFSPYIESKKVKGLTAALALIFIFPIGRTRLLIGGQSGSVLASALVLMVLGLFARFVLAERRNWRVAVIAIILMFTLTNTYHTWATYFAILVGAFMIWYGLQRSRARASGGLSIGILVLGLAFWFTAAVFLGNGNLYSRILQAAYVIRNYPHESLFFGPYDPSAAGPLRDYLRERAFLTIDNLPNLAQASLMAALFAGSSTILVVRKLREQTLGRAVDFGIGLTLGTVACVMFLALLGGLNLALGRGFEILSVSGPLVLCCALSSITHPTTRQRTKTRQVASLASLDHVFFLRGAALALAVVLVFTGIQQIIYPTTDEELSSAEAVAVHWLSPMVPPKARIWSDDRIAPSFLYYGPQSFVTFDIAYTLERAANATISVFYDRFCQNSGETIRQVRADVIIVSRYMETRGVVLRAGPLIPSANVQRCLDESFTKVYDDGAVSIYTLGPFAS